MTRRCVEQHVVDVHHHNRFGLRVNEDTSTICVRGEGVQGVLTLFCSGAAQVCHDDRVVELKEQLEVQEEDGDRQEEEEEVEREKRLKESAPWMTMQMEV